MILKTIVYKLKYALYPFTRKFKKRFISKGEKLITQTLRKLPLKFDKEKHVFLHETGRHAFIDFMVKYHGKRYAIEYNGAQHYQYIPHFHRGGIVDYEKQVARDEAIRNWCNSRGIELIEIPYTQTDDEIVKLLNLKFGGCISK